MVTFTHEQFLKVLNRLLMLTPLIFIVGGIYYIDWACDRRIQVHQKELLRVEEANHIRASLESQIRTLEERLREVERNVGRANGGR